MGISSIFPFMLSIVFLIGANVYGGEKIPDEWACFYDGEGSEESGEVIYDDEEDEDDEDDEDTQDDEDVGSEPAVQYAEFSSGFAKGRPIGIYESGRGILMFLSAVVLHPIQTGQNMYDTFALLSSLARSGEWNALGEALAPEMHQLVQEWEVLPLAKRGELAGFAFGKYGADLLVPGAIAKTVSKGLKGSQRLNGIYKELKTAERVLEPTSISNVAKHAEVIQLEKRISEWLGDSVRFARNHAGDPVFLSKDGLRKVRFDFNKPFPHESPHLHLEELVNGEWKEISRVYPFDVPHR
jgi:hypothetical protein